MPESMWYQYMIMAMIVTPGCIESRMNWPSHCNVHLPNAWKCFSFKRASISWFSQVKRKDSHSRIPPMRSASLMTSQKIPKMNENIFDIFVQPDPRSDGLIKPSSQSQSMVKPNCLNLRPPQQCNAAWYVNPLVPPRCYRTPSATHWDQWCETSECVWKQPVLGATKMKGCIDDVFHIIFCKIMGMDWMDWDTVAWSRNGVIYCDVIRPRRITTRWTTIRSFQAPQ